jgi:hypothetical protein
MLGFARAGIARCGTRLTRDRDAEGVHPVADRKIAKVDSTVGSGAFKLQRGRGHRWADEGDDEGDGVRKGTPPLCSQRNG